MSEQRIADELLIDAPVTTVWDAIKDPITHARWHPFLTAIDGEHALGAERYCSIIVGKKHGTTRERCVEEDDRRRISWAIDDDSTGFSRMVSDWRAGFILLPAGARTREMAESVFQPTSMLVRLMSPIVKRKFHQTQTAILAGLKNECERDRRGAGRPRTVLR
jgi:uncharacterized protein YndB with AHSA1/START domain